MNTTKMKSVLMNCLAEAGALLKKNWNKPKTIEKKSELSLVTQVDKAAEKRIIQIVRKSFPDHAFLAEESLPFGNSDCRWIIDPLDGTTNFAHNLTISSVTIAFEYEGTVLLGGTYDPFRDELFFAQKGKGSTLNGKKIHVSKTKKLGDSLLCTGFPYDRRNDPDQYLRIFREFLMTAQEVRRLGSAALDLAYVACGRLDGYWEFKLQPWDKAAGILIVEEAGGKFTDLSGNPAALTGVQSVATNGIIHAEMLKVMKPFKNTCL
ncbi:MAG: inositol monophosphatase [Candidatus Omnitrophica bacterium]|nr:inositol monophosphatase [Candidatus Omnitrophota bacterium]